MKKWDVRMSVVGGVLLLIGAVMQITGWVLSPYLYIIGALLFAYVQTKYGYDGTNFVIKRLRNQQLLAAMLLVVAGVLMFVLEHNEWIVCLTIAAVIELYTSFRIPQEEEKERRK